VCDPKNGDWNVKGWCSKNKYECNVKGGKPNGPSGYFPDCTGNTELCCVFEKYCNISSGGLGWCVSNENECHNIGGVPQEHQYPDCLPGGFVPLCCFVINNSTAVQH